MISSSTDREDSTCVVIGTCVSCGLPKARRTTRTVRRTMPKRRVARRMRANRMPRKKANQQTKEELRRRRKTTQMTTSRLKDTLTFAWVLLGWV